MSDIGLHSVDIRFPAHMFPPSLYEYVTETLKKDFILVLNKIDLAPAPLVVAWKKYFEKNYPNLHIAMFTTLPGYNLVGTQVYRVRKRRGKFRLAAEGSQQLFEVCKSIVGDNLDISSWQNKIKEEMNLEYEDEEDEKVEIRETVEMKSVDTSFFEHEKNKNGVLTIGCLGQPNFSTTVTPKVLQVLMGSFPIAQLREPFTTVKFLGERLDLPNMLRIQHPEDDDTWCAMDICDGWAKKREYWTSHPDMEKVKWIQAKSDDSNHPVDDKDYLSDESDNDVAGSAGDHKEPSDEGNEEDEEENSDSDGELPKYAQNKFAALAEED
ncbi:hypothetical protein Zmor_007175 [Zophobas morio]|uniref:Guanine nucleotide-binding protein-like 1 n=1 Tax=Zophobas morio TaxID=2755281 RepID=A0AA38ITC4_9CUCU|nr:hypothetical protein Zmor_007175 [Zophobas morio]